MQRTGAVWGPLEAVRASESQSKQATSLKKQHGIHSVDQIREAKPPLFLGARRKKAAWMMVMLLVA